ncbi:tetratricopeptide repeat protein [Dysgonomonas alginatilytica]|uniref:Tetratricopeptide repeat protein n=1 Tax=Dysgonomonas alginatilytica TaxID=1605892 RepID=A0A2V3PPB6_9BACT|nr:tetratricopeptide repeat protein [Dysgonomonas alginatilytica]PXV62996.1 tetratricopeptide repeat protein [Dysgonomonas alginatilytica]
MKYISLIISLCLCFTLNAQTAKDLAQAKLDYKNNDFAKALPVFEREHSNKPTDPSLNLWLGVCLFETGGNIKQAEEYLLIAAKRNLPESYLYLGDIYIRQYRVSEAQQQYERYTKARPKEKETTLATRNQYLDKLQRAISRTEDIQIIDSLIVSKNAFLSAYKLSSDAGSLSAFNDVFEANTRIESTVYTNGKGSKIYFGQPANNRMSLFSMDKLLNGYGNEKKISNNNLGLTGGINYPFVLTDGSTIYFAGEDENGLGGYDIYVTRYNLNNDTYLTPELLNMPFNSTANDYLYVFDEEKGIGWFATDRFQPEGRVCVYTFIPNEEVKLVESDDEIYKENRAKIASIKSTWRPGKNYSGLIAAARKENTVVEKKVSDFTFVINDRYTYNTYADFKSSTARNLYFEANEKRKALESTEKDLDAKRTEYISVSGNQRSTLASVIQNLENRQAQLYKEVQDLDIKARNEEIKALQ